MVCEQIETNMIPMINTKTLIGSSNLLSIIELYLKRQIQSLLYRYNVTMNKTAAEQVWYPLLVLSVDGKQDKGYPFLVIIT